jgi:hypothetical protein
MKCISVSLAIALFLAVCVPAVLAQEQPATEQPAVEPPIIPPDIEEALSGTGIQPVISLALDLMFAVVNGAIALILALWSRGCGSLVGLVMAWVWVCQSVFPMFTWIKGSWHLCSGVMRYIPCFACIPNGWNAIKVTLQILGI